MRRLILVVCAAVSISACSSSSAPPATHSSAAAGSSHASPTLSRTAADQLFLLGGYVKAIRRVEAKEMRLGDLRRALARYPQDGLVEPSWVDDRLVWVVAMSGDVVPDTVIRLPDWTWAVRLVSATPNEQPVVDGFQASSTGEWPPYFDALPDLAGH